MIYFTSWRAQKGKSLHGGLGVRTEHDWFTGFAVFPLLYSPVPFTLLVRFFCFITMSVSILYFLTTRFGVIEAKS